MLDVKNLTWQQLVLCTVLLVSVIVTYKLFGDIPGGVLLVISSITNLLLGRVEVHKEPTP